MTKVRRHKPRKEHSAWDVSMLDDGLEFKKEIRTINISLVHGFFFPSLPPVPLSGEMDPSEDPSTKSRQAAEKSGSKRYDALSSPRCG